MKNEKWKRRNGKSALSQPILILNSIEKKFGPTIALDGVNLQLREGEVHALIGENGAGKSTLMNVLAGSLRPDRGAMEIDGTPYLPTTPLYARDQGIALIHQELSLCPHLSVAENIMMGIEPSRAGWLNRRKLDDRTREVLETFPHPEIRPRRPILDNRALRAIGLDTLSSWQDGLTAYLQEAGTG